eukprot:6635393-Pyramimonas_sp.AAC.1
MPPAEHALVGARQTRCRLHAPVALDPVERVLVAPPAAAQHRLRPPADFYSAVRADDLIPLLRQRRAQLLGHHLRLLTVCICTGDFSYATATRRRPADVLHVKTVLAAFHVV